MVKSPYYLSPHFYLISWTIENIDSKMQLKACKGVSKLLLLSILLNQHFLPCFISLTRYLFRKVPCSNKVAPGVLVWAGHAVHQVPAVCSDNLRASLVGPRMLKVEPWALKVSSRVSSPSPCPLKSQSKFYIVSVGTVTLMEVIGCTLILSIKVCVKIISKVSHTNMVTLKVRGNEALVSWRLKTLPRRIQRKMV